MEYNLKHHLKLYDGIWILVLCFLSIPPVMIAMLEGKIDGLAWFLLGFVVVDIPLFIAMQIKKVKLRKVFKTCKDVKGTAKIVLTGKLQASTVEDNNGNTYRLCGTYGNLDKELYKCKFKHDKKNAWITYIDK